jgi:hypothetical protein
LADGGHTGTGQKENGFVAHCELAAHSSDTAFGGGCVDSNFRVGTGHSEGLKRAMLILCNHCEPNGPESSAKTQWETVCVCDVALRKNVAVHELSCVSSLPENALIYSITGWKPLIIVGGQCHNIL